MTFPGNVSEGDNHHTIRWVGTALTAVNSTAVATSSAYQRGATVSCDSSSTAAPGFPPTRGAMNAIYSQASPISPCWVITDAKQLSVSRPIP
ncbi:hypothetical protein ACFPVT_10405 [Corynebacterium choanae]